MPYIDPVWLRETQWGDAVPEARARVVSYRANRTNGETPPPTWDGWGTDAPGSAPPVGSDRWYADRAYLGREPITYDPVAVQASGVYDRTATAPAPAASGSALGGDYRYESRARRPYEVEYTYQAPQDYPAYREQAAPPLASSARLVRMPLKPATPYDRNMAGYFDPQREMERLQAERWLRAQERQRYGYR